MIAKRACSASRPVLLVAWLVPVVGSCGDWRGGSAAVDLEAPRLVGVDLPEDAVSPTRPVRLRFSEPIDARSVGPASVLIVPHEEGAPCTVNLACGESGRCYRGRCQTDRVNEAWLADAARPPLSEHRVRSGVLLERTLEGDGLELVLQPLEPLAPLRLHTLVASPGLTDLSGNPLTGPANELLRRFATADAATGRPTLSLLSPADMTTEVPTNLDRVVVGFSRPVQGVDSGSLWLEVNGRRVASWLQDGSPLCAHRNDAHQGGPDDGRCFVLRLADELPSLSEVTLGASEAAIRDLDGQRLLARLPSRFATGAGRDSQLPGVVDLQLALSDGCAVLRLTADEPVDLVVRPSWRAPRASLAAVRHEIGLPVPPGERMLGGRLTLLDLAGNPLQVRLPDRGSPGDLAQVVITEVLADPLGPEPAQEFVELLNRGQTAVDLGGWTIDDNDDGRGCRELPAATLVPGGYAVLVGARYVAGNGGDPVPCADALLLRLDGTLGHLGLSNRAGETLALRDSRGRLVSTYGGYLPPVRGGGEGVSVERIDPTGCDVEDNWQRNPGGASSPGWSGHLWQR